METNQFVLYRIFDSAGVLLYVGATTRWAMRIGTHAKKQPWWDEATEIKLQRFDTAWELGEAEVEAIQRELPKYNVVHTGRLLPTKPRGTKGGGSFYHRSDGLWVGKVEMPYGENGQRRAKYVSSKDRLKALRKFEALKASVEQAKDGDM